MDLKPSEPVKQRCRCAQIEYRNLGGGEREYRIGGNKSCRVCRGSGFAAICPQCDGAGVFESQACPRCGGPGKIRMENSGKTIRRMLTQR